MLTINEDSRGHGQKTAFEGFHGGMPGIFDDPFNGQKEIDEKLLEIIGKDHGFFVEIGPGDGIRASRTGFLEKHGWQGILIEPDIELCARCIINRPKSAVLNYNCLQDDMSEKNPENANNRQSDPRAARIKCRTLESILDEFQVEGIDLLVLNTDEKQSLAILKGMGFSHCRIENILIMQAQNSFLSYLGKAGYDPVELKNDNPDMNAVLFRLLKSNLNTAEENIAEHLNTEVLNRAWDIAARSNASYPGKYIAYYSLDIEGRRFPGERPWEERWEYIGRALREACGGDLNGKRVLELGCNLGLLSVWAAREGAVCQGYEYEADILEGARLTASAFGVSDRCRWSQADFNKKEVTDSIVGDFDICTCLSVMNWVRNKDNLINFLSTHRMVIYEGHDNDQVETDRLRRAGFSDIERVAVSERGRGVFLARNIPGGQYGMILEMAPLRMPDPVLVMKKSWGRIQEFLFIAMPLLLAGSVVLGALDYYGVVDAFSLIVAPVSEGFLGLPAYVTTALLFGILRKEMAFETLAVLSGTADLGSVLTGVQLYTFAVISVLFVPCISTIAVILRQMGGRVTLAVSAYTITLGFLIGGLIHFIAG